MTGALLSNFPMGVDQLPIREWLARTQKIWEKRLAKHELTGESVGSDGTSLGERVAYICRRFHTQSRDDARQDDKLCHLLSTCNDPHSPGSTWLRAVLPWFNGPLNRAEQLQCLARCLKDKIAYSNEKDRLAWATLATRAGVILCNPRTGSGKMEPGIEEAMVQLISTAWQALPETMVYQGKSMLPAHQGNFYKPTPWQAFLMNVVDMLLQRKTEEIMPSELLPLQLWMAPDFDGLPLNEKEDAKQTKGLLPNSLVSHRAFLMALETGIQWPKDARIPICLEWIRIHNPYLAPTIEAVALDQQTKPDLRVGHARARL